MNSSRPSGSNNNAEPGGQLYGNPGFPRNPSLASLPLFFTVCSIFYFPPTHPRTRAIQNCRALPPVRWWFDLYCARALRERGPGNQPNIDCIVAFSPHTMAAGYPIVARFQFDALCPLGVLQQLTHTAHVDSRWSTGYRTWMLYLSSECSTEHSSLDCLWHDNRCCTRWSTP